MSKDYNNYNLKVVITLIRIIKTGEFKINTLRKIVKQYLYSVGIIMY